MSLLLFLSLTYNLSFPVSLPMFLASIARQIAKIAMEFQNYSTSALVIYETLNLEWKI